MIRHPPVSDQNCAWFFRDRPAFHLRMFQMLEVGVGALGWEPVAHASSGGHRTWHQEWQFEATHMDDCSESGAIEPQQCTGTRRTHKNHEQNHLASQPKAVTPPQNHRNANRTTRTTSRTTKTTSSSGNTNFSHPTTSQRQFHARLLVHVLPNVANPCTSTANSPGRSEGCHIHPESAGVSWHAAGGGRHGCQACRSCH